MIRDITLGQFYPGDSILHRLDPRVKLLGTVIFVISLFMFDSFYGYIAAALFLAAMIIVSKVPFSFMIKGLRSVVILLVFTSLINMFLTPGELLCEIGPLSITKQGVRLAVFMLIRIVLLIVGSSIMTLTTTPSNLTDGLEKGLGFLKIFKAPVHEVAMMMSIALSFIPILLEELDKIMKAQQARGADFESGNIIKRVKSMVPILIPLFISAFRRSNELAMAMETRCYRGGEGRTKMKPLVYKGRDYAAYLILILYLATVIAVGIIL